MDVEKTVWLKIDHPKPFLILFHQELPGLLCSGHFMFAMETSARPGGAHGKSQSIPTDWKTHSPRCGHDAMQNLGSLPSSSFQKALLQSTATRQETWSLLEGSRAQSKWVGRGLPRLVYDV